MSSLQDNNFVFMDKQGKRWPRFRIFMLISGVIVFLSSVVFVQSLFVMSQLHLPPSFQKLKERLKVLQKKESLLQTLTKKPSWLEFSRTSQTGQKQAKSFYKDNVTRLLQKIADSLHAKKMELWLRVPMGRELKVFDIEALSTDVDRFIAVLHDENSETDQPGPDFRSAAD